MTTLVSQGSEPPGYPGGAEEALAPFFNVRDTVISQYANSPILLALIDALGDAIDWQARADLFFDTVWNIETATGYGLDVLGRIVGVTRALYIATGNYLGFAGVAGTFAFGEGIFWGAGGTTSNYRLTDDAFRRVILAKAALNITDGSISSINAILRALFPDSGNPHVRDNNDMTMTFVFGNTLSTVDYAIVTQSGVLPRPIGVSVTVEMP